MTRRKYEHPSSPYTRYAPAWLRACTRFIPRRPDPPQPETELERELYIGRRRSRLTRLERQKERLRRLDPKRQLYMAQYRQRKRDEALQREIEYWESLPIYVQHSRLIRAAAAKVRAYRRRLRAAIHSARCAHDRWARRPVSAEYWARLMDLHERTKRRYDL